MLNECKTEVKKQCSGMKKGLKITETDQVESIINDIVQVRQGSKAVVKIEFHN